MKKLILVLLLGLVLVNGVWAAECTIARPYFGSVNCDETGSWSDNIYLGDNEEWICEVPNCIIVGMDRGDFSCSGWGTTSRLRVNVNGIEEIFCDNTFGTDWGEIL